MIFTLMDFSPPFYDFYDLKDGSLFASLFFMGRGFRFFFSLVVGGDGAWIAGDLREIGHCDLDDDKAGGMKVVDGKEIGWSCEVGEGVVCEIVDLDDLVGKIWHYLVEEVLKEMISSKTGSSKEMIFIFWLLSS